jgi:hypothetical protein
MKFKYLSDGTTGFRYTSRFLKGLVRLRSTKRRWGVTSQDCMIAVHTGRLSVYVQRPKPSRRLHHFAG